MQKFDVLVAGGGLVGAAFACALGKEPFMFKM